MVIPRKARPAARGSITTNRRIFYGWNLHCLSRWETSIRRRWETVNRN